MNKHNTQSILNIFILLTIAISSGCGAVTAVPDSTVTPMPSRILANTITPSSINLTFPTVTPASTKSPTTPVSWKWKMHTSTPTPDHYSISTQQAGSECLPPLTNFSFPVGAITDIGNINPHIPTIPPKYWQFQTSLPEGLDFQGEEISITSHGDVWIRGWRLDGQNKYFIYSPNGKSSIYPNETLEKPYVVPEQILYNDGVLWGLGTSYDTRRIVNRNPIISRYDESVGRFEYVENILYDAKHYAGIVDAKLDDSGFIWMVINQPSWVEDKMPSGVYRFDPYTQKADYFLAMPEDIWFAKIQPIDDGSIWILAGNKAMLLRYFPATADLQPYSGTFSYLPGEDFPYLNINAASPLFLDSKNRLWIGNEGWLNEPTSELPYWYRILQSPIFINVFVDGSGNFYRDIPDGMNETSDGMFWFWGDIGTVRLDPKIGEWCLFTTYSSPVVEDKDHNLWMVADNKLYKYPLSQK